MITLKTKVGPLVAGLLRHLLRKMFKEVRTVLKGQINEGCVIDVNNIVKASTLTQVTRGAFISDIR